MYPIKLIFQTEPIQLKLSETEPVPGIYCQQFEGKEVDIEIEKAKRKRSNPQNSYLWGVCYKLISDHTGYEIDEVHEMCKAKFNPKMKEIANKKTGEIETIQYSGSTTKMTTVEFMDFVAQIQRFFAPLGINIPDPNQTDFIEDAA